MSKLQRIKTMLSELLELEMGSATSDKGVIYWNEETIEVGTTIYVQDEDENKVLAEDGDYEIDGKIYTVEGGKVKEIADKLTEEVVEEEPTEEPTEDPTDEPEKTEDEPTEEPEEEPVQPEEEEPLVEDEPTTEEPNEVDGLRKEIDDLRAIVDVLKAELEALKGKPLAMSAAEEFQVIQKNTVTKGVGRYADAIAELRKK